MQTLAVSLSVYYKGGLTWLTEYHTFQRLKAQGEVQVYLVTLSI